MRQMRSKSTLFSLLLGLAPIPVVAQVGSTVPNWTVPPYMSSRAGDGLTTMTDFTPPRAFVAVTPCRVVDTRNPNSSFGGPPLPPNFARTFDIDNGPCGIPAQAEAYSLSFGAIVPPADGFLTAWPTGTVQPGVSQLNFLGGEVVANAAIVPAGANGAIDVLVNVGTNIYIDINGYFSDILGNTASPFLLSGSGSSTIFGQNTGTGIGVLGTTALVGFANGGGVVGRNGLTIQTGTYFTAGVRGEGPNVGLLGLSPNEGVTGDLLTVLGASRAFGILGFNTGAMASQAYAVYGGGNFGGTGTKYFVEPHPTDSSKVIRYISLEGGEPGTYFRGKGKFERGTARIPVPEDFRLVTDSEGLTVQVTPIGPMATVSVVRYDLNEIVVQSSRNVEFFYLVNGIRRTHKHLTSPISEGTEFMPRHSTSKMPAYLTEGQKRFLIQNGTYRADGTVNLETAQRNGWDRIWAERERPGPAQSPE